MKRMTWSQKLIRELDPSINPVGVEAHMLAHFSTLGHLSRQDFINEISIAKACEAEQPGFLRKVANSFGMGSSYDEAQELVNLHRLSKTLFHVPLRTH